ncbi:hypothetical protein [Bradyrhizobium sp. SZCCHNRI3052]|uniref:hypothetical protein n=1 Tax=Bradyrhizobium sp. SZCCHNRI3052 TaxID=3057295 RepID=UPI0029167C85|nr:hypothetical protein [Bradyrhizobium sp. SZCCHNRI3052]
MKRKRTTFGTLIDEEKARAYYSVRQLFFIRWLERRPFVKWALESWIEKPWRR